jgi:hypothetical protein
MILRVLLVLMLVPVLMLVLSSRMLVRLVMVLLTGESFVVHGGGVGILSHENGRGLHEDSHWVIRAPYIRLIFILACPICSICCSFSCMKPRLTLILTLSLNIVLRLEIFQLTISIPVVATSIVSSFCRGELHVSFVSPIV